MDMKATPLLRVTDHPSPSVFRFFSLKQNKGDYRKLEIGGGVWRLRGCYAATLAYEKSTMNELMFFFLLNMGDFPARSSCSFSGEKSRILVGGFKYFVCSPLFGEDSHSE